MCVYEERLEAMAKNAADRKVVREIKEAVCLLNSERVRAGETSGRAEFKVKNQNGVSLEICRADTDSLTVAMVLHEKAKGCIGRGEYLKALILLAEADGEFK